MKYIEKIGVDEQICPLTVCMCSGWLLDILMMKVIKVTFQTSIQHKQNIYKHINCLLLDNIIQGIYKYASYK
jgi:hypothetical protein